MLNINNEYMSPFLKLQVHFLGCGAKNDALLCIITNKSLKVQDYPRSSINYKGKSWYAKVFVATVCSLRNACCLLVLLFLYLRVIIILYLWSSLRAFLYTFLSLRYMFTEESLTKFIYDVRTFICGSSVNRLILFKILKWFLFIKIFYHYILYTCTN